MSRSFRILFPVLWLAGAHAAVRPAGPLTAKQVEVVEGWAIVQGDVLIGPAASVPRTPARKIKNPRARHAVATPALWPGGVIPFRFDASVKDRSLILEAMQIWSRQSVVRFVPRTDQKDFVTIRASADVSVCSSAIGYVGGEQYLLGDSDCGLPTLVHELGHTIGLHHEHARPDRDSFVRVLHENIDRRFASGGFDLFEDELLLSPEYDYGSIMHYAAAQFRAGVRPVIETIPPGIPIAAAATPSALDYDSVNRMYGAVPSRYTVTTHPEGLEVVVDGAVFKTPAVFDWKPGEQHELSVRPQQVSNSRFRFGRWSDEQPETHTITVDPETTVYVANMVRYFTFTASAIDPPGAGVVEVLTSSEDGFYRDGTVIALRATPNPGYHFSHWTGPNISLSNLERNPANPWTIPADVTLVRLGAKFSRQKPTIIRSNVQAGQVRVDGELFYTPIAFDWPTGESHQVEAIPSYVDGRHYQHVFRRWTDDASASRTITAGARSDDYVIEYGTRYRISWFELPAGGTAALSPPSDGGFYDAGAEITITARPEPGWVFANWGRDLWGTQPQRTLRMNDFVRAYAAFAPEGHAGDILNAATWQPTPLIAGSRAIITVPGIGPSQTVMAELQPDGSYPRTLAGLQVLVNSQPVQLLFATQGAIAFIAPGWLPYDGTVEVTVLDGGKRVGELLWESHFSSPGIYPLDGPGMPQAVALGGDDALNGRDNPAARGSVLTIFLTGHGAVNPEAFEVRIDSEVAGIVNISTPPNLPGIVAVTVKVPEGAASGEVPVLALIYGQRTQLGAKVWVK